MKCNCGYEHEKDYNEDGKYVTIKGDKPFKNVNVVATIEVGYFADKEILSINMCPECGALYGGQ